MNGGKWRVMSGGKWLVAGEWWFVTGKICSFRACSDL